MSLSLRGIGLLHPNGQRALRGVDLTVAAGERLAVIGPSGAGKTSLLRIAAAAVRPSDGTVEALAAQPWMLTAGALRRLRARIGVIHQAPPIPPRLRVVTAVLAGRLGVWSARRALTSLFHPADSAGAGDALARVELADRLFDRCDRLSGGQLQRVGIARVLYQSPDLLLADEPVSALDPALADRCIGELAAHGESTGATLIASLHAVDLALRWFPRIVGLRAGEVVFDAAPAAIDRAMLHALYATEGGSLPVHGGAPPGGLADRQRPAAPPDGSAGDNAAEAATPHDGPLAAALTGGAPLCR